MGKEIDIDTIDTEKAVIAVPVKKKRKSSTRKKILNSIISKIDVEVIKNEPIQFGCKCNINEKDDGESLTVTSLLVDGGTKVSSSNDNNQQNSDDKNNSIGNLVKNNGIDENLKNIEKPINQSNNDEPKLVQNDDLVESRARNTLVNATILATEVLVSMLTEQTATNSLKVDCAKEILNRVYGKTFVDGNSSGEKFSMAEDLLKYCE